MPVVHQAEAIAGLSEFHSDFFQSIAISHAEWIKHDVARVPQPFARTVCDMMHDVCMRELMTRLGAHQRIKLHRTKHQRFFLKVAPQDWMIHIKKLNDDWSISNFKTASAKAVNSQSAGLRGVLDCPRITLGYRLDETMSELLGVYLMLHRSSSSHYWKYPIGEGGKVLPLMSQPDLFPPIVTLRPGTEKVRK